MYRRIESIQTDGDGSDSDGDNPSKEASCNVCVEREREREREKILKLGIFCGMFFSEKRGTPMPTMFSSDRETGRDSKLAEARRF